ncbi:hypothetical protein PIB30_026619 [Stylosanthes scabra]|uniref:Uncharacterized protein n=1 Tax=Stylosanthes scabra TaxID=79078 RepID=A0ABU6W8R4_9FABA|nr:hypothetical protein [Stylosanthes scabra]
MTAPSPSKGVSPAWASSNNHAWTMPQRGSSVISPQLSPKPNSATLLDQILTLISTWGTLKTRFLRGVAGRFGMGPRYLTVSEPYLGYIPK